MIPALLTSAARVRLPGGDVLDARVLGVQLDELVLHIEQRRGDVVLPGPVSTPVQVALETADGQMWWDAVLAGTLDLEGAVARTRVRLLGAPLDDERRHAPRAPVDLPLEIAAAGEPPVPGRLVEVSQDSIKVKARIRLLAGDLASVVIDMPDAAPLRLTASVVRYAGEQETALIYELIPREKRDALVRYAFTQALLAGREGDAAREPGAA